MFYKGEVLGIDLLNMVILEVVEIELGIKGDIVFGGFKLVMLEIGVIIQVLFFVKVGDKLIVNIVDFIYVLWV